MHRFSWESLGVLNKSTFNEKTGWRDMAYASICEEARYAASVERGKTSSICAACTIDAH